MQFSSIGRPVSPTRLRDQHIQKSQNYSPALAEFAQIKFDKFPLPLPQINLLIFRDVVSLRDTPDFTLEF